MTKNVLASIYAAARDLARSPRALAMLFALYVALIASIFFFITTRVATLWQLFVTGASFLLAPLLFFVVQAAGAGYAVGHRRARSLARHAARSFMQVLLVSIPFILLAVLSVYLLDKLERRVQLSPEERARIEYARSNAQADEAESASAAEASRPKPPVRWKYLFVSALRLFVLGIFLPLAAMHLWLAVARDGLFAAFARIHRHLARAFSAQSLFTYGVGMIVFALIPYFLITKRTPVSNNMLELAIFGARIFLAFSLMLFGWVMTLTALADAGRQTATAEPALDDEPRSHAATAPAATS
jgi:MFS family permease